MPEGACFFLKTQISKFFKIEARGGVGNDVLFGGDPASLYLDIKDGGQEDDGSEGSDRRATN